MLDLQDTEELQRQARLCLEVASGNIAELMELPVMFDRVIERMVETGVVPPPAVMRLAFQEAADHYQRLAEMPPDERQALAAALGA